MEIEIFGWILEITIASITRTFIILISFYLGYKFFNYIWNKKQHKLEVIENV